MRRAHSTLWKLSIGLGVVLVATAVTFILLNSAVAVPERMASELLPLGREPIVDLAAEEIRAKHAGFSRQVFDRVEVLVGANSVFVSFSMSVRFVPLETTAYYGVLYGLADPGGPHHTYEKLSNPKDRQEPGELRFFEPDSAAEAAIALVLGALGLDPGTLGKEEQVTIREREHLYAVSVESPESWSYYDVAKQTGDILEAVRGDYLPPPSSGAADPRFRVWPEGAATVEPVDAPVMAAEPDPWGLSKDELRQLSAECSDGYLVPPGVTVCRRFPPLLETRGALAGWARVNDGRIDTETGSQVGSQLAVIVYNWSGTGEGRVGIYEKVDQGWKLMESTEPLMLPTVQVQESGALAIRSEPRLSLEESETP